MPKLEEFVVGIGTNMGNKLDNIINSLRIISQSLFIKNISNLYQSPALLVPDMPRLWREYYLNIAILVSYDGDPQNLLSILKKIEQRMGRNLNNPRLSPRIIDLDILISTCKHGKNDSLQIPHKSFFKRSFAYLPTKEVFNHFSYKESLLLNSNTQKKDLTIKLKNLKLKKFKENLLLK